MERSEMKRQFSKAPIERMKRPKGERSRMGFPKVKVTGKFFHPALEECLNRKNETSINPLIKKENE